MWIKTGSKLVRGGRLNRVRSRLVNLWNEIAFCQIAFESRSKLVRWGRSNRVRRGDRKGSDFKTICSRGMPAIVHYGVRSTFYIQTPHVWVLSPFFMFLHFWVSVFVSLRRVEGRGFFFRFVLLVAYRASRFFNVVIFLFCATSSYKPESWGGTHSTL